jgi:hypothetical protein
VDPRAGLDDMKKILDRTGTRIPTPSVVQPVASRCTDYAIPAQIFEKFLVLMRSAVDMKNAEST